MAIGDVNSKVLFDAVLTNVDAQLTAGPATGFRWIATLTICNRAATAVAITLYRRFTGPKDRYILSQVNLDPKKSLVIGPIVIDAGVAVRGLSDANGNNLVDITADGYDEQYA